MKRSRLSKWNGLCQVLVRPNRIGSRKILAFILGLSLLLVQLLTVSAAVSEGPLEQSRKGRRGLEKAGLTREADKARLEVNSIEPPETAVIPASVVNDKGKQIKWQLVCSGGGCGSGGVSCQMEAQNGYVLCGSAGQLAAGPGSSPSYGVNSGFWQENLPGYLRGDANGDGVINSADIVYLINYLFADGPAPDPLWVGDCNCDDVVNSADVIFLVNYLFAEGPPPEC